MKKKYKVGYTSGVFDLFHIGHLNVLKNAKERCEKLVVGVSIDSLTAYKFKTPVIPFSERIEIIKSIKYVDAVLPQTNINKMLMWDKVKFDVCMIGDDWKGTDEWNKYEQELKEVGVDTIYLPYTKGPTSTLINNELIKLRDGR